MEDKEDIQQKLIPISILEKEEKLYFDNSTIPISIFGTKYILDQMRNSICKIINKNGENATGFFIKINYQNNYLCFLITNYHVLKDDLKDEIIISIKDEEIIKTINLNEKRRILNSEELDVILIEILPIDKIRYYLEIDEDINKDIKKLKEIYKNKSIYILHYENEFKIKVSYGILKGLDNNNYINHFCNISKGSIGSPILSLETFKVVGMHKENSNNYNIGIFIKEILNKIFYNNNKKISKNKINLTLNIDKDDINKKIYFLDNTDNKYYINKKWEEHHHDNLKELNILNVELYINNIKYKYEKYFILKKKRNLLYYIKIIYRNERL